MAGAAKCPAVGRLLLQTPPGPDEARWPTSGLHAERAARGDAEDVRHGCSRHRGGSEARDARGRTPLQAVAARFWGAGTTALRALVAGGADPNAPEAQRWLMPSVTIAAWCATTWRRFERGSQALGTRLGNV